MHEPRPVTLDPLMQPIVNDVWRDKYAAVGETTYADTCARVAKALDGGDAQFHNRVYEAMLAREIIPAGRILTGAGTDKRVTLINCFVSPDIQDSMGTEVGEPGCGIMHALSKAAYTLQMGGGIGMDFSTIRPRGAIVKRTASVSSGVIPFMNMWHHMSDTIMSAGHRRGAMMGTLGCWHPDIEEFIEAKHRKDQLTNFNVSVLVTDEFMKAVKEDAAWHLTFPVPPAKSGAAAGVGPTTETAARIEAARRRGSGAFIEPDDRGVFGHDSSTDPGRYDGYIYKVVRARELWDKIIGSTYVHAEPGVIFIDRVNALNNLNYCEHIHCTNPCFPGETLVWTAYGPRRFDELARSGKTIPVLTQLEDGSLAYRDMTKPRRTRRNAELLEVILESHSWRGKKTRTKVRCTPNHEIFLLDGSRRRADALQPGDQITSVYRRKSNSVRVGLRGSHEFVHEHWVACEYQNGRRPDYPREHAHHKDDDKSNNTPENLEILPGAEHDALKMRGDLNPMRRFPEKNPFNQPGFSAGENNGRYRNDINDAAVAAMRTSGLTHEAIAAELGCSRWTVKKRLGLRNHRVISVRALRTKEDVYCGTVKATGRFFVLSGRDEGILVSNCGEQPLPANGDCNLGHVNLAVMVDCPFTERAVFNGAKHRAAIETMVQLLDNVLDVTQWPTEEQRLEAMSKRRIGLGFTGLGSALQQLGIPYGSAHAVGFVRRISKYQAYWAYKTSCELAKERGAFPLYDADKFCASPFVQKLDHDFKIVEGIRRCGIRNGVLLSIAPTGTTSIVAGNISSGIEPVFSHQYRRKVRGGSGELTEEYSVYDYGYLKYCQMQGIDPDWQQAAGAVMGSNALPVGFVTADQLTVEQHLQMTAAAQEWTDAAISKTINCPTSMSFDEFKAVYTHAYELGLKGCTTYRPDPRSGRGSVLEVEEKPQELAEESTKEVDLADVFGYGPSAPGWLEPAPRPHDKIPMQEVAEAKRYRIKWPTEDCAYYVTITDHVDAAGRRRPFELFINTKSERHSEWVKAFSLLVTAILRREGDPSFVVDELKSVFSAQGGTWVRVPWVDKPKLATSLVAAIGLKLEEHMRGLGLIAPDEPLVETAAPLRSGEAVAVPVDPALEGGLMSLADIADICAHCGARAVIYAEGCATCHACGKSDCG